MRLALNLVGESPAARGSTPRLLRVTHVKMRSFIAPSQRLDIGVTLDPARDGIARAMLTAKTGERVVASARLELAAGA